MNTDISIFKIVISYLVVPARIASATDIHIER